MFTGPDPTTETNDGRYIHSYPKVPYPNDAPALADAGDVVIEEKLDGGNYRVLLDNASRVYGSKKKLRGSNPEDMNVFFRRPAAYIEDTIDETAQQDIYREYGALTLFGENLLRHSLDYQFDSMPAFLVFDVWSHTDERFLPPEEATALTERLNLEFVPILETLPAEELKSYFTTQTANKLALGMQEAAGLAHALPDETASAGTVPNGDFSAEFPYPIPESEFRDGLAEGVVLKNYDTQTFAKHVSDDFKEVNDLRFGFTKRHESGEGLRAVDYTKFLVAQYVTDTRIEKQLRKLVMDRGELGMELMPALMDAVYEDVWAEHGDEIIYSGETVDMGRFHDLVADRCRYRLKAVVDNREMIADMEGNLSDEEYLDLMAIGA